MSALLEQGFTRTYNFKIEKKNSHDGTFQKLSLTEFFNRDIQNTWLITSHIQCRTLTNSKKKSRIINPNHKKILLKTWVSSQWWFDLFSALVVYRRRPSGKRVQSADCKWSRSTTAQIWMSSFLFEQTWNI